ncbi:general transcription factor 3C polypeptide 1 [Dendroctonus ponderosae]|uniref:general transcription factor 3C polypeptide 1 n=1 Tax=Dendroctonus ponderosae TaxID=77166 RepID=UPI002034D578|nr:general transcription factor 3C polypeptide 1 [Dendroctonus ponderosae]
MGKFIETKLSERNVKIAKRRPANLGGKTIGKALPRRRKIDQNTEGPATEKVSSADFQDLSYEVGTNPVSGRKCLRLINPGRDLFAADDLKASYWQFTRHNLICILFEEIALEGLDGITLQALWKRIENVLKFQLNYQALKEAIWRIVCLDSKVQFYELPEERQNLDLPWTDPTDDSNFFTDPRNCGNDPYTVEVPAKEYGEWGSCSTLKHRRNVSEAARQMSLSEAFGTYKNKLVLVADEDLRRSILYEDMCDPNCELMPIEYCILERIGRARELGEMSAGTTALSTCFGMDQKSIHHYIKKLNKQNLVTRQICLFSVDCEHSRMGRLIQLRRFHSKKKSKQQIMIERAVNYLKKCADFKTPYADIKSLFEPGELVKQFKQTEIDHYINLNLTVPYKEYYEGSTYQEYMMKNLSKERMVQLAKLRDPYVNVEASWVDHQKEESSDDAEDDEDDDADEGKGKSKNPMKSRRIFNKDLIRDVYQYIVSKGKHGISTSELNEAFDSDFSSMRTIIKKLTTRKLIAGRKIDVGRNTMNRFTATRLVDEGQQDSSRPISIQTGSSTALEKLKQRQRQKILNEPQTAYAFTAEGYLKAITIHISSGTVKKTQTFLCLPRVPLDHHVIQENLQHLKEKVICHHPKTVKKPGTQPKEAKSPFTQADVIQSLTQIQRLIPHDTVKPSKTSARCYGRRPKFARLALIHELFYYLIFEESSSTPLSKAAARDVLHANQIRLSDSELEAIPPMYCREISWKTFIHPMPKHFGWDKGWGLLGDVIMRFPLVLITRCYSVNFYSHELQELLQHPIKRFYTLKDLPVGVRTIILYRRKFLYDMISQLHLLCYCGLVQLGPSGFHEKEKMFFYMNRKATLWDTTSIKQDYTKIAEKDYPKIRFEFHRMDDVMKYWSTMNNICLHTELAIKLHGKEGSTAFIPARSKPSLLKAKTVRTKANVKEFDTGEIPGDHLGGAGLDSSLYSHLPRSWHLFTISNQDTVPESLNSLKLDKTVTLKPTNKHFLSRPRENKHLPLAGKGGKQKKRKKINQPQPRRSIKQVQKIIFDSVDRAVIRKFGGIRYRPRWTQEEDKLLILLRMAIFFLTPSPVNKLIGYRALRDLLYIKSPKSRDKTSSNVSHRFTLLKKSVPFLANIELIIPNLYKLEPIAKYFVPLKHFLMHGEDPSGLNRKSRVSIQELRVAFVFLGYYILNNQKDVEVALHGKFTSIDYFNKTNYDFYTPRLVACAKKPLYVQPTSEEDIKKYTLTSTILCSLSHRNDTPEWSVHNYKVWQQFTQPLLKSTLTNMKEHRMVQFFREQRKLSLAPYRLSLHFIFSQSATFTHHTMDEAFAAFIQLKNNSSGTGAENECGHLFGFNEVLSISASTARMEFNFPEHHFVLNPDLEDHSEVIEELAKRYQAKLKGELKEAEALIESGARPEDDDEVDSEMPSGSCEEPAPVLHNSDVEVICVDDGEPMDLSINATINNLKHWISDCIDLDRVRSPSPEIFNFSIKQEVELAENAPEQPANPDCKVPSLEEIKQEMLKPLDSQEKRLVPHVCDLTKLLSTTFEEIETDDRASYLMKKYFVQQYPTLQSFKVDGLETLAATLERTCSIAEKLERDWKVGVPTSKEEFEDVLLAQGIVENVGVAWDLLRHIEDANVLGATGFALKEAFPDEPIALILIALTEHHYVVRTGICEVTFVHFKHQEAWLTKTCSDLQEDAKTSDCSPIQVSAPNWFKIKAAPWTAIDGTLDAAMLKLWLSQVFSYCIENSKIPLRQLCCKFCYLKPVDVFYLLELLEEIGALEIRRLVYATDLFSEDFEEIEDCKGSFMDRFDEMYVDSKNVGFITVGSCFQSLK